MIFLNTNTQKVFNKHQKHKILIVFMLFFSTLVISCGETTTSSFSICDDNPCAESLIPHKTVCSEKSARDYTCVCEAGYELKDSICVNILTGYCEGNPCSNNSIENKSKCQNTENSYVCVCNDGYEADGDFCKALAVDSCNPNPCNDENKTKCTSTGTTINDFICSCNDGFEANGDSCVRKVGKCDENSCTELNKNVCTVVGVGYDCSCNADSHEEASKCVYNTKRVSCKPNNPNKPANSTENSEAVDVSWDTSSETWSEADFCSWTCFDEYEGTNCDQCSTNYVMQNNSCVFDCSGDINSEPNDSNNTCVCKSGYHLSAGVCVETVDPCNPNQCLTNTNTNKTNCIANSQTAGDYTCICESGYEENESGVCTEVLEVHIRAVAANITTGNCSSYYSLSCSVDSDGEGMRILQGLKPNVIMVQEFNYKNNTSANYREMIEAIFQDPGCSSSSPQRCFYSVRNLSGHNIPNGVISKFPILEDGYWSDRNISNRNLDWAILDIPGDKELFTISVHLHTSPSSDQVEAAQVIAQKISEHKELHPNQYYYIVGGDFNGSSAVSNSGFGEYQGEDIFDITAPKPKGEDGSTGTSASRSKILDWILTSYDLSDYQISSDFCSTTSSTDCKRYTNGLVMDTRDFSQAELNKYFSGTSFGGQSLNTGDSDGSSMQHQAVVKDFKITF